MTLKKVNFILFILGLLILSCNKPPKIPLEQAVIFKAITADIGFKSGEVCNNPMAHYAALTIQPLMADGVTFYGDPIYKKIDVFYLNGNIYSSTLNLPSGDFAVISFVLMNDNGTPDDFENDIAVYAIPAANSDYANFVSTTLPLNFTVEAFMKNEIPVQVLCITPSNYPNFGLSWFEFNPIALHALSFYGNLCIDNIPAYENTIYKDQNNGMGLSSKIPAIFKIDVYLDEAFIISYSNESWLGENAVLNIQYPDYEGVDHYKFILSVKVLVGYQLQYMEYYTWTCTDSGELLDEEGQPSLITNGVLDFVVGNCDSTADLIL